MYFSKKEPKLSVGYRTHHSAIETPILFHMFWAPRVVLVVLLGVSCTAQTRTSITPRPRPEAKTVRPATFRLDARMVQIPVTVTDSRDRPQLDLEAGQFHIFEDGVEQQIAAFSMADAPISTGVVFDTSGSMKGRMDDSRAALEHLFETAAPQDEFSLVRFSDRPELVASLTHDPATVSRLLGRVIPHGWTALYDAIFYSVQELRHASNPRRALLVLSDGEDNNSRYSESEAVALVREADIRVYAVGIFRQTRCLAKMAAETGGRVIWVHKLSDMPEAIERLTLEMRNVYMVSYFSSNPPSDGKYRKVKVEVQARGEEPFHVTWRHGYYAP
jgi:Ca-activated chloride channel family protein